LSSRPRLSPCFIPARLWLGDSVNDVNLTRIGADRAQISTSAPIQVGDLAQLELNRPTDGQRVRIRVHVTSVQDEGVSRGWTPSVMADFEQPLEEGEEVSHSAERSYPEASEPRDPFTIEELLPPEPISLHESSDDDLPVLDAAAWEDISEDSVQPWEGFSEDTALGRDPFSQAQDVLVGGDQAAVDATLPPDGSVSEDGELPDPDRITADPDESSWRPDRGLPRRDSAHIPWLDDSEAIEELSFDREERVFSEVAVVYMLAGKRHAATVQDFGLEGMYLAAAPFATLPAVGDMIRIEFPVVLPSEVRYVRMFTEVRWTYGQVEPDTVGRGVGIRIVDFEAPVERQVYEEYVTMLLAETLSESVSAD